MIEWVKDTSGLTLADIQRREPYKLVPHAFKQRKRLPWPACQKCGLLALRNRFTAWAITMGCNNEDHPDHARMRRESRPRDR